MTLFITIVAIWFVVSVVTSLIVGRAMKLVDEPFPIEKGAIDRLPRGHV